MHHHSELVTNLSHAQRESDVPADILSIPRTFHEPKSPHQLSKSTTRSSPQMQPSAHPHRRTPVPAFVDHTPRDFEITAPADPSRSPDMLSGVASMGMAALGAGPLYTNAVMGQAPSAEQREHVRKASSTVFREDSIKVQVDEDPNVSPFGELASRPDSLHYARTDQPPYVKSADGTMMTQTSLLSLPRDNASHDLAFFLKTTGPNAPNRRPKKIETHPRRAVSASKNVLKWLKVGPKRPPASVTDAHFQSVCLSELSILASLADLR